MHGQPARPWLHPTVLGTLLLAPASTLVIALPPIMQPLQASVVERGGQLLVAALGIACTACFARSFCVGLTYLLVRNNLKRKRLARRLQLPPLTVLDQTNAHSMGIGFVFLTCGILCALARSALSTHTAPIGSSTLLVVGVIWLWYATALQLRVVGRGRGRRAAFFSIIGFGGLLASALGLALEPLSLA